MGLPAAVIRWCAYPQIWSERWDGTPLGEQQKIIGRDKMSGAPLGLKDEHDVPDYAKDPKGDRIPLDAHIRLANPRTKRPTPVSFCGAALISRAAFLHPAQLDMGLLFVCFQSDLNARFSHGPEAPHTSRLRNTSSPPVAAISSCCRARSMTARISDRLAWAVRRLWPHVRDARRRAPMRVLRPIGGASSGPHR